MQTLTLARWQFAITITYHYLFVPLTLGLTIIIALVEGRYVRTGDRAYRHQARFWGELLLINFAIGVVTGLVQEFQFGMNWSEYARFIGDVFGIFLAVEAMAAFYLESTFLGFWVFSWDRVPKRLHLAAIWLVAIASNLSAFWILAANAFMQEPTGYVVRNGRVELVNFWAAVTNPHLWHQFPHVLAAGITTAAFFVLGISAHHLRRRPHDPAMRYTFRLGTIFALVGTVAVIGIGHAQGQYLMNRQPMKMAAAEALWETERPAAFSLVAWINEEAQTNTFAVRIPALVSFLAYNDFTAEVKGLRELQTLYAQRYGPGNYIPPVTPIFWSFRLMVGTGSLLLILAGLLFYHIVLKDHLPPTLLLRLLPYTIPLPYLANTTGWLMTELGRQPWLVFGLQRVEEGVSPNVNAGMLGFSLGSFTLLYGAMMSIGVWLMRRVAVRGTPLPDDSPLPY